MSSSFFNSIEMKKKTLIKFMIGSKILKKINSISSNRILTSDLNRKNNQKNSKSVNIKFNCREKILIIEYQIEINPFYLQFEITNYESNEKVTVFNDDESELDQSQYEFYYFVIDKESFQTIINEACSRNVNHFKILLLENLTCEMCLYFYGYSKPSFYMQIGGIGIFQENESNVFLSVVKLSKTTLNKSIYLKKYLLNKLKSRELNIDKLIILIRNGYTPNNINDYLVLITKINEDDFLNTIPYAYKEIFHSNPSLLVAFLKTLPIQFPEILISLIHIYLCLPIIDLGFYFENDNAYSNDYSKLGFFLNIENNYLIGSFFFIPNDSHGYMTDEIFPEAFFIDRNLLYTKSKKEFVKETIRIDDEFYEQFKMNDFKNNHYQLEFSKDNDDRNNDNSNEKYECEKEFLAFDYDRDRNNTGLFYLNEDENKKSNVILELTGSLLGKRLVNEGEDDFKRKIFKKT